MKDVGAVWINWQLRWLGRISILIPDRVGGRKFASNWFDNPTTKGKVVTKWRSGGEVKEWCLIFFGDKMGKELMWVSHCGLGTLIPEGGRVVYKNRWMGGGGGRGRSWGWCNLLIFGMGIKTDHHSLDMGLWWRVCGDILDDGEKRGL